MRGLLGFGVLLDSSWSDGFSGSGFGPRRWGMYPHDARGDLIRAFLDSLLRASIPHPGP